MAKVRIVYEVDDKELKALDKELKGIQQENKKVEEGFKGTNEEIKKGKTSLVDLKGAVAGLGLAALAGAAIKEFVKLNAEINKSRKEVAQLTKATGLALDSITAKLRATSKVFDKDFNEILRAANTVSKEFGISMSDALKEINDGFTRGLDVNGEYLDTLREYSTFINQAGLNTKQFNILIQKQATQGIFSDKGIDALKEGVITLNDMTPAAKDAINAVGLSSDKILKDIEEGTITAFEAIQQITKATKELNSDAAKGSILAEVFRGAGEDAGKYVFTLEDVGEEFAKVTDEEQKYIDAQTRLLTATEETEKSLLSLTANTQSLGTSLSIFWEEIKGGTIRGLDVLITSFTSAEKQIENFRRAVAGGDKESLQAAIDDMSISLAKYKKEQEDLVSVHMENTTRAFDLAKSIKVAEANIAAATEKMAELDQAEIDEAEAADAATIAAEELAKAKGLQVIASEKARKESEKAAKALEEEAEAQRKATAATKENLELQSKPAFEAKSDFLQEVEAKAELNEILVEQEQKLNDDLLEINKNRIDDTNEAETEGLTARGEAIFEALFQFSEILGTFADLRVQQISQELQAIEFARNRELELVTGNKEQEAAVNKKFDDQKRALEIKQLNAKKASALFEIAINTALNVVKAFPNPFLIALAAILGAAQAGVVLSQKVPSFAKGVIDLQGPGTTTSDSINARLSAHESVMTAQETFDFKPTLKAIRNREISPDILNNISMHQDTQPRTVVYDYEKLAKAVMNQPQKNLIADENGLTGYFIKQGKRAQIKQSKYSM